MDRIVGIDLGTTNSVIAYTDPAGTTEVIAGQDGGRIVPSAVYFDSNGEIVVGTAAREQAQIEPDRVAMLFKRGMGERSFLPDDEDFVVDGKRQSPEELSAIVLRKLVQMAADHYGEPVHRAVITVPAYFGEVERAATKAAGKIADLDVVRIVNEPTAAAIAHGIDHSPEAGKILVFDLGGGTFDVTVMEIGADGSITVIATGGDRRLGGMDFDQLIVDRMVSLGRQAGQDIEADGYTRQQAYIKAEEIKKKLSFAEKSSQLLIAGGRPLPIELTRAELEKMLAIRVQEVEDTTLYTLEEVGLRPADISKVLMVGGSSRIPVFQRRLAELFGREPTFTRNLDEDVARGAAMLAAKEGGQLDPRTALARRRTQDVISQGLGITVTDPVTRTDSNSVIVQKNTPIIADKEDPDGDEEFATIDEGQTGIMIHFNEGDSDDLMYVKEIENSLAPFGRRVRLGYPIRVKIKVTVDGTIRLWAHDGETGSLLTEMEIHRPSILSEQQQLQARSALAARKVV